MALGDALTKYEKREDDAADTPHKDVEDLASRVINVLRHRQSQTKSGARQFLLDYLLRAAIQPSGFHPPSVAIELRGHRIGPDAIIDLYIPWVAEELGNMWVRSELDFATVTIGALRLQSLLGEVSSEITYNQSMDPTDLAALVVVPQGEQHFLGAHVAAAQLRRFGVSVSMSFCESDNVTLARVEMDAPDMVLMSCARLEGLEVIERSVKKIKLALQPSPVLAIGGSLKGNARGIRRKTDVDLVTNSVKEVVAFTAKRRKALAKD